MVVWRRRIDNDWLYRAQTIVEAIVQRPEEYDEPTCGPGPFSMADADTTSDVLAGAGFSEIALRRCDIPIVIGSDVQEALELVMAARPAGEILRLAGDLATHLHGQVEQALREGLAEFVCDDGQSAPQRLDLDRQRPRARAARLAVSSSSAATATTCRRATVR